MRLKRRHLIASAFALAALTVFITGRSRPTKNLAASPVVGAWKSKAIGKWKKGFVCYTFKSDGTGQKILPTRILPVNWYEDNGSVKFTVRWTDFSVVETGKLSPDKQTISITQSSSSIREWRSWRSWFSLGDTRDVNGSLEKEQEPSNNDLPPT